MFFRLKFVCVFLLFLLSTWQEILAQCQFAIVHNNSDTHCLFAEEEVVWKNTTGVSVSGNTITKNIVSGSWDAGGLSVNSVNNNGWATTTITQINTDRMIGLSASPSATPGFSRSQFGIYLRSDAKFAIYESGSHKGNPAGQYTDNSYRVGDIFKIKVDRGVIKYYQNTTLLMQSTVTPTLPLTVDATLNSWSPASAMASVKVFNGSDGTFTSSASSPGTGATYQWMVDGVAVATGSSYFNPSLTSANVLTCQLVTGTTGCLPVGTTVNSNSIRFTTESVSAFAEYNVLNTATPFGCLLATEPVAFSSLTNTESTGNTVSKTRGSNFTFDGGAFAVNAVQNNGYVEATIPQNNKTLLFGLSAADAGVAFGSIQFAFYVRNDGQLEIYESSSNRTSLGAYVANVVLKIQIDNGVVKYYTNGILRYTSTITPSLPLYPDVAFNELNGAVNDVKITNGSSGSFSLRSTALGTAPTYQWKVNGADVGTGLNTYSNASLINSDVVTCQINTSLIGCSVVTTPALTMGLTSFRGTGYITTTSSTAACAQTEETVTFTDQVNVSATSNSLQKVLGNDGFFDAGATSLNKIYNNGYARFTVTQNNTDRYFGVSSNAAANTHSSADRNTIQYAIQLAGNSQFYIYESGVYRNVTGTYSVNDQFKIMVDNNVVRYYRNSGGGDVLLYSSAVSATALLPLVVDVSLSTRNSVAARIDAVMVSTSTTGVFQAITANAGTTPVYQWEVNGVASGTNAPVFSVSPLNSGDVVKCFITPDIAGCSAYGFLSNSVIVNAVGGASSPTTTWTGVTSSAWNVAANWSNGVPQGYTKAVIPSGTANSPQINITTASVYDLTINSGATLAISGSNSLNVFNQWNNQGVFTANTSTVNFKTCTNNKNTIISGATETFYNLSIENATGADLSGEHHIGAQLTFTSGILKYAGGAADLLVFDDNAIASGMSDVSHVAGKVKKRGNDAFTFPIGKGSLYRKLTISAPSSIAESFTAEYFKASPFTYGSTSEPTLWTVSGCEYWTLDRAGTSSVEVELSWNQATNCSPSPYVITHLPDLRTTFWDGTRWRDSGNGSTTGDVNNGTIRSAGAVSSFNTAFTLASASSLNPLPLTLVSFEAEIVPVGVTLSWQTETEINTDKFVVQRSDMTLQFQDLETIEAMGEEFIVNHYSSTDRLPVDGKNYYRLKMVDIDGSITYSTIIAAHIASEEAFTLYPNPVKQGQNVFFKKQVARVVVCDQLMRIVAEENRPQTIDTTNLSPGTYYCFDGNGFFLQRMIVY